jgi:CheY-like chemotaxis protein
MATRALRTPSILLVSHSVDEREVYARSLRISGCRVLGVATTAVAYQIATTRSTDMVVTDGHSPGSMSGLELTRRLRIHARTTHVPIIVLTAATRRQDAELSIKAGANMFLERPLSGDVLREHVVRLLVARGSLSRRASHQDLLRLARKAPDSTRTHAASSHEEGPAPAAPVSGSPADVSAFGGDSRHLADDRTCPECRATLEYRRNWPVLTVPDANVRRPQERLRYVSGWFCRNARCAYRDLAERKE